MVLWGQRYKKISDKLSYYAENAPYKLSYYAENIPYKLSYYAENAPYKLSYYAENAPYELSYYAEKLVTFYPQLPESNGRGSRYVERIDIVVHRDAGHVIRSGDNVMRQAVAFGAHDDGETRFGHEIGVVNRNGIVGERHSHGAEAQCSEFEQEIAPFIRPSPRNKKDATH